MEINVHRFVPSLARVRGLSRWLAGTRIGRPLVAASAVLGLIGSLAVTGVALAAPRSPFSPASPQAQQIENLFIFLLVAAGLIFLGVEGTLIYSSFAHRAREGRQPSTTSGNTRIEIAWTVAPTLLLAVVFVLTVRTMHSITAVPSDPLVIRVVAHQFWWEFDYPNADIVTANELHVPVGQQVVIHLESADVIHSFWVPQLA
ncbi:MAG TPA: cytochrome c oxidase subunit II, partial [Chloroflexota bacterium]|nr:cytochrome c oxidase subunit II [Chloroflexota bacterium]